MFTNNSYFFSRQETNIFYFKNILDKITKFLFMFKWLYLSFIFFCVQFGPLSFKKVTLILLIYFILFLTPCALTVLIFGGTVAKCFASLIAAPKTVMVFLHHRDVVAAGKMQVLPMIEGSGGMLMVVPLDANIFTLIIKGTYPNNILLPSHQPQFTIQSCDTF